MKNILIGVLALALVFVALSSMRKGDIKVLEPVVVTNFEECAAAGNPVMESYPRQCNHEGQNFVEVIDEPISNEPVVIKEPTPNEDGVTMCDPKSRPEACTMQYEPVCGLVQVECITTPCDPVPQTFGNGCSACGNARVISYTEGECSIEI